MPRSSGDSRWRALARGLLPARLRELVHLTRAASPDARPVLLRRTLFGRLPRGAVPPLAAGERVLFVCYGNILRSAFAEALLRTRGEATFDARSAGTHAVTGRAADARGIRVAREFGVDLTPHRATLLSDTLIASADRIFVMDRLNEAEVLARFPGAAPRLQFLGLAAGEPRSPVIPDPYMGSEAAVRAVYGRIAEAIRMLAGIPVE